MSRRLKESNEAKSFLLPKPKEKQDTPTPTPQQFSWGAGRVGYWCVSWAAAYGSSFPRSVIWHQPCWLISPYSSDGAGSSRSPETAMHTHCWERIGTHPFTWALSQTWTFGNAQFARKLRANLGAQWFINTLLALLFSNFGLCPFFPRSSFSIDNLTSYKFLVTNHSKIVSGAIVHSVNTFCKLV